MHLLRTTILAFLFTLTPALAGQLDGTWSGTGPGGAAVSLVVEDGAASNITFRGKYADVANSKASNGGARLEFTFPKGSGVLKRTAAGADLTVKITGSGTTQIHVTSE